MDLRMTSHISPLRSLVSREMLFITCSVHGLGAFDKKSIILTFTCIARGQQTNSFNVGDLFSIKPKYIGKTFSASIIAYFLSLFPRDTEWEPLWWSALKFGFKN